jgi:hypothetical protein
VKTTVAQAAQLLGAQYVSRSPSTSSNLTTHASSLCPKSKPVEPTSS